MNFGRFSAEINRCWSIARNLGLDTEFISTPDYPESPRAFFKGMSYREIWEVCFQNRYYNFHLHDNSLIYFSSLLSG